MSWQFNGDVNLEHGGTFINLDTFGDGYCDAVVVTDLDSGCGFTGAVMVEHVVINGTDDAKRIREALRSCGYHMDFKAMRERMSPAEIKQCLRHMIADSLCSYGHKDPDDSWDGYCSHHTEILQLEADGPMKFDGWKADKRLRGTTLEAYVQSQHLKE